MKRRGQVFALFTGIALVASSLLWVTVAFGHGWVVTPPSRQDNCAKGRTSFDCGDIKFEPQSVEAPKGAMSCSGGSRFTILDDDSLPWPVNNINSTVTIQWSLTAAHRTSTWEYFVDGRLHATFNDGGAQPPTNISHTLTGLPSGRHKILARWNIFDTANAFYNCIDVNVGGGTTPSNTPVTPTNTPIRPTNTPIRPTNTPIGPTNTPTRTPVGPTNTPTRTAIPGPTNTPTTPPTGNEWAPGVAYKVGDIVTHLGVSYRCQIAHTSQPDWEPQNTPALWVRL